MNTMLEFKKIQKVRARLDEIRLELSQLDGRRSPEEYNAISKLAAEAIQLQRQIKEKPVKLL